MKQGATYLLAVKLDANMDEVAEIIFTLQGDSAVQKRYPYDVSQSDGLFSIPLTQEDTMLLCKTYSRKIEIEAQINYTNLSVSKTSITEIFLRRSLATEIVDGNTPTGISATEVSLEIVGGVLVATVSPEYIKQSVDQYFEENPQLTEDIKASFDDTKQYVDEKAKQAADSANSAKESQTAAETAKTAAETARKKTETAASEVQSNKESALTEISQAKTDSVTEITATANSGVQSVTVEKDSALSDIADSAGVYLQSISTNGQSQIDAIMAAGESEITDIKTAVDKAVKDVTDTGAAYVDSIKSTGEAQTKTVNEAGKSQTSSITTAGAAQVSTVNTAGETQLFSIQTASIAAQTAIGTAKEESVSAVRAEGETQVENIRQSAADYESLAIKETVRGESILIEDSAKWQLKGLKLFGKSTQDGTPSPENPVPIVSAGDGGQIEVELYGENLFGLDRIEGYLSNVDGTITLQQNETLLATEAFIPVLKDTLYYFIDGFTDGNKNNYGYRVGLYDANKNWIKNINFSEKYGYKSVSEASYLRFSEGYAWTLTVSWTQIDKYVAPAIQSLPYPTPTGLPGIPVSSGGNYTDENGQRWVCDEVDFGRGVYVRRVKKIDVTSFRSWEQSESFGGIVLVDSASIDTEGTARRKILSNRFLYDKTQKVLGNGFIYNGVLRLYLNEIVDNLEEANQWLAEHPTTALYMIVPEEIPLPDSILTAYAALHTNYPTTTVLTDSGAGMKVEYVADTRNYIGKLLGAAEHGATLSTEPNEEPQQEMEVFEESESMEGDV